VDRWTGLTVAKNYEHSEILRFLINKIFKRDVLKENWNLIFCLISSRNNSNNGFQKDSEIRKWNFIISSSL